MHLLVAFASSIAASAIDPQTFATGAVVVLGSVIAPFVLARVPLHDWKMRWAAFGAAVVIAVAAEAVHGDLTHLDFTDPLKLLVPALAISRLVSYVYDALKTRYSL